MSNQLQFELVSPEKLIVSQPVAMVTVPGGEGEYGVLPGHAPMITTVKPGIINIYADNENTVSERIFVAGGFAEVTEERCTVLAEEALHVADIDKDDARIRLQMLNESLRPDMSLSERAKVEADIAATQAKIEAAA